MVRLRYGAAFAMSRFRLMPRPYSLFSLRVSFSTSTNLITFLTDVEGDAAYLNRHVQQSKVLHFTKSTPTAEFPYSERIDFLFENAMLVYGGDIWDRGGSDLYTIRQLLDLSRRYKGRVHFILGNRDLNKMRILDEIGVEGKPLPKHDGVYWLRGTGRVGDPLLLKDKQQVPQTNSVDRLKWILSQTMGSPDAFELRKRELQRHAQHSVSDENVVDSYRRSCHPNGEMGQYLQQAHLALRLGNVLFVHGALPLTQSVLKQACQDNVSAQDFWNDFSFAMPWHQANENTVDSPNAWLAALERFARKHVHDWKDHVAQLEQGAEPQEVWSTRGGYCHSTLGNHYEALLQYGMGWTPDGNQNPTIVYSSWLNDGMPHRFLPNATLPEDFMFAELTREFFKRANLQLILSGHQPHGDMPTRIRVGEGQSILCCDTSYSGDTMWWNEPDGENRTNIGRGSGSSGRGDVAVSEVLIEQDITTGEVKRVECHGTLSDGESYNVCHFPSDDQVGQLANDHFVPAEAPRDRLWWVKAKFDNGSYLVSSGEGFNVWNCVVTPKE